MNNFNEIKSKNDLAHFLKVPLKTLTYILYVKKPDNYYNSFEIPKKNAEPRYINAPIGDLKNLQRKLSDALWEFQKELVISKKIRTNVSHGFEKEKGIITNAKIHVNKRYIINLDLENFFDSFHFGRVRGYFEKNQNFDLPIEVATILAQLTCYKMRLPQGAPTSPIITNFICNILDMHLVKVAKKFKLDYTRYADDLTFSTNDKYFLDNNIRFYNEAKNEIERFGLSINEKKTRLIYKDSRQEVTGLVVNKKININNDYYRATRAMANHFYRHGKFTIDGFAGDIKQLEGRFAFINQLDRNNNRLDEKKHSFRNLNSREMQYRNFLFYKYFFVNPKPLIITEGKTDKVYIKSALKKHYIEYPELIEKKGDEYEYKISFLNRSLRLEYFLGIYLDGADTLKNVCCFYKGKENLSNLSKYFEDKNKSSPKNPVFLIFDNEQITEKPLQKFKKNFGIIGKIDLSKRIINNLYLLTNPLVNDLKECELEDLFEKSTLSHKIGGKKFSKEKDFDKNKCYGKHIFSGHVSKNYIDINFSHFLPMLDELNNIIKNYYKS